jgi:hypothetical protein
MTTDRSLNMERSAIEVCDKNHDPTAGSAKKLEAEWVALKISMVARRVVNKEAWQEWLSHGVVILAATEGVLWALLLLYALSWVTKK